MKNKVFVLVSDGVSLRNFAYTSFYKLGIAQGYDVVFWNATPFNLEQLNLKEVKINNAKPGAFSDVLKTALIRIELNLFSKRDKDDIYHKYKFPLSYKSIKASVKSLIVQSYITRYSSEKGILKIRQKIASSERKTSYYKDCKTTLETEKPDFILSTSQRALTAFAPLTAAQDLNIPTASFIYSWDNIPKATTVVTTDFYFVWSTYMKNELLHYQRYIASNQIRVTGTPQFENHFDIALQESKTDFFKSHNLDLNKKYICFSGDDITTSPKDEMYLRDLAKAVRSLNKKEHNLGVVFRKCPVDFSDRYDAVIKEYNDVIVPIEPKWKKMGAAWNSILPTKEDYKLQTNIIAHTECVVNLGSSMVFDYAAHNKPCAFIDYNYLNASNSYKKGVYVYDFVHFRSMPSSEAVIWLSNPNTMADQLAAVLENPSKTISKARAWFEIINAHPPEHACNRFWEEIEKLVIKNDA
ncbi:UDP-glycosyltransferase [Hwangdonia sp.]|uniref:UDP-glycosyltransferase n=1 Tax=Hwangdonia sp. TaxID=1883432 RepID=UPI003AB5AF08